MSPSNPQQPTARLVCNARDEHVEIAVLDGRLREIPLLDNLGMVELDLEPGVYVVQFRSGSEKVERIATLTTPGKTVYVDLDQPIEIATPVPVFRTRTSHEYQSYPAQGASMVNPQPAPGHQGEGKLFLFLRDPFGNPDDLSGYVPEAFRLKICDEKGMALFDFAADAHHQRDQRWSSIHLALDPGLYILESDLGEGRLRHQGVYVCRDWQTQVFANVALSDWPEHQMVIDLENLSLLMARPGMGFDPEREDFHLAEVALKALSTSGNIPGAQRTDMLWMKFENPLLGIYAAYLHLRRKRVIYGLMNDVFHNLHGLLGPIPEVLCLGQGLLRRGYEEHLNVNAELSRVVEVLNLSGSISRPPMLRCAWQEAVQASIADHELIPTGSLAERVAAQLLGGSRWVAWQHDPELDFLIDGGDIDDADPRIAVTRGGAVKQIQELLDEISELINRDPVAVAGEIAEKISGPVALRLVQQAFPQLDPFTIRLLAKDEKRRTRLIDLFSLQAPDAQNLISRTRLPGRRLLKLLVRIREELVS
ncbi:MAG: hypothetical protein KDI06_14760 [Calditrichaeota bacterium]|nr:hypothetical protein [Calditrichota bacterium]HQU72667.1 hypothetical protein [Calditrichia bacterium]